MKKDRDKALKREKRREWSVRNKEANGGRYIKQRKKKQTNVTQTDSEINRQMQIRKHDIDTQVERRQIHIPYSCRASRSGGREPLLFGCTTRNDDIYVCSATSERRTKCLHTYRSSACDTRSCRTRETKQGVRCTRPAFSMRSSSIFS